MLQESVQGINLIDKDTASLRQKAIAALTQREEPISYRELTDTLWNMFPELHEHMLTKYGSEKEARAHQRVRLGILVKNYPSIFSATKSADNFVLVGLAASEIDADEEIDDENASHEEGAALPAVYWYTFPAYQKETEPYPIKIGRGNNPQARIAQQVTSMPEQPLILGTFEHEDTTALERALHSVLTLRGKRKKDAPGIEWFITTPVEIENLIKLLLNNSKNHT